MSVESLRLINNKISIVFNEKPNERKWPIKNIYDWIRTVFFSIFKSKLCGRLENCYCSNFKYQFYHLFCINCQIFRCIWIGLSAIRLFPFGPWLKPSRAIQTCMGKLRNVVLLSSLVLCIACYFSSFNIDVYPIRWDENGRANHCISHVNRITTHFPSQCYPFFN